MTKIKRKKIMTTISNNKIQVLEENFSSSETSLSFREWIEQEAQNDPDFFRFLFDEDLDSDFDSSLSEEQREAYEEFVAEVVATYNEEYAEDEE